MENDDELVIKTKYAECTDYVFIKKNELSFENYCIKAANVFKVQRDLDFKVKLKDNSNVVLTKANFNKIVNYYSKCSCFYVKIQMEAKITPELVITPDNIESYLIDNNADKAIVEERQGNPTGLVDSTRRALIGHLANYAISVYGLTVTRPQLLQFSKAVIVLFPSLSLKNGDKTDTDLLCDSKGNGYLSGRIKYLKQQQRQSQIPIVAECENQIDQEVSAEVSSSCQEDIDYLKTAVINENSMDVVKTKLTATSKFRRQLIRNNHSIDLLENFPYFFHTPKLVEYEFSVVYEDINPKSFLAVWQSYGPNLKNLMQTQFKSSMFVTKWSSDIDNFLMLLKLFPFKPIGRNNTAAPLTFKNSIDKLIVYSDKEGLPETIKTNDHPYIIACGPSQKNLTHFYIDVEKHLLNVPEGLNALETFDFFFKVHKVFNLEFDPSLKNAMNFVQHFLYNIQSKKVCPTTRMLEIYNKTK